ncbi:MAG TPA: nucleotidyltransferase domain-containing protein [Solirubrobacterales bacterium]
MDLSRPFASVSPGVESDVLVTLAATTAQKTGRELARLTGRSVTGVQHAIDRLVNEGLVHRAEAGPSFLYALNRDHLMAPAVDVMASARCELVGRLRDLMDAWQLPPFHASLFGSAARGEGNPASDIDLLVVRATDIDAEDPAWQQQLDDLAERTLSWTGNDAGIVELAAADIPRLLKDRPPVLDEVVKDGIDLAGLSIRQMLRGAS